LSSERQERPFSRDHRRYVRRGRTSLSRENRDRQQSRDRTPPVDHIFEQITTLARLGISFETRQAESTADYEYTSSNGVSINFKAAGQLPALGSALTATDNGVTVEFATENAVLFQAAHCRETIILGLDGLASQIISKHETGEWQTGYAVVTSLVSSAAATILVSSGKNGRIDLLANTRVGGGGLVLADLNLNLCVAHASNMGTRIVAATGLTPLFRTSGLKKRLFGRTALTRRGGGPSAAEARKAGQEVHFAELDYGDFD
jgi:hypothetical protein